MALPALALYPVETVSHSFPPLMLEYVRRLEPDPFRRAALLRDVRTSAREFDWQALAEHNPGLLWARLQEVLAGEDGTEWEGRLRRLSKDLPEQLSYRRPIHRRPMASEPLDRFYWENRVRSWLGLPARRGGRTGH